MCSTCYNICKNVLRNICKIFRGGYVLNKALKHHCKCFAKVKSLTSSRRGRLLQSAGWWRNCHVAEMSRYDFDYQETTDGRYELRPYGRHLPRRGHSSAALIIAARPAAIAIAAGVIRSFSYSHLWHGEVTKFFHLKHPGNCSDVIAS